MHQRQENCRGFEDIQLMWLSDWPQHMVEAIDDTKVECETLTAVVELLMKLHSKKKVTT